MFIFLTVRGILRKFQIWNFDLRKGKWQENEKVLLCIRVLVAHQTDYLYGDKFKEVECLVQLTVMWDRITFYLIHFFAMRAGNCKNIYLKQ